MPRQRTDSDGTFVGRSITRLEDRRLLWGRGRYLADLADKSTLHVAFVRSTEAHALLLAVDASLALKVDGVVSVLTGADVAEKLKALPLLTPRNAAFAAATECSETDPELPCLAFEKVCYVGQLVAAVVAESRAVAEDACEEVVVQYESLPVVTDAVAALLDGAPCIHRHLGGNEAGRIRCEFGDVDAARRSAALTVEGTYSMGRHGGMPLECRGVLARIDDRRERIEVWSSTQIPHLVRTVICAVTGWTPDQVRVSAPDVGGGFGTKANVYAEEIIVPLLARSLGRDVIWVEDRSEHLISAAQGRDQSHLAKLSLDSEGHIVAWEDDFVVNVGAGSLWTSSIIANTAIHLMGAYRIPAFRAVGRAAYTNKAIVAQYRGAGRPEACFVLERSLDRAAQELGISPVEIRRRNLLTAADLPYPRPLPYRDGIPIEYDGGNYLACLDACVEMLSPADVKEVRESHPDLDVGYGVATYIEATGKGPFEYAEVALRAQGRFLVTAGCANSGQGHETVLAQVAADVLCTTPDRISVVVGDTDATAEGVGTFASRSAVTAGNAVQLAGEGLVARATQLAAKRLGVPAETVVLDQRGFHVLGEGISVDWSDLASGLQQGGRLEAGNLLELREGARFEPRTVTWTMGAHAAIVGVDRETGVCSVLRYAAAHEGGVDINPMIVEGQILGAVAQGIGGALLELFAYDSSGQPVSASLAEYLVPTSCEIPRIDVRHLHGGGRPNPLGLRGVGESGIIPVYPAIAAAVDAALGLGGAIRSTPISAADIALALASRPEGGAR